MKPRVLIAPAPLKEIEHVYGPALAAAGAELVFPGRPQQLTEAELLDVLPGCVGTLAGSEPYTRAVIAAAAPKGLKVIARAGVGYDAVDLAAATEHGVAVTVDPGTNQESVAEHTFTLILALARHLIRQHNGIAAGGWPRQTNTPLRGSVLGLLGLGRIGKAVARVGRNFGMTVIGFDPFADAAYCAANGIELASMDDVFRRADWVSLHMPMLPESRQCVNARTLGLMKPTAYLINTARGGIVDEAALDAVLRGRKIAGAAIDCFENEPLVAPPPFADLDNVVLAPHCIAWTDELFRDIGRAVCRGMLDLADGRVPRGVVNPEVLDRPGFRAKWNRIRS
jgi:phosphoglycerate dehydrogenase-like enzyme